MSDFRPTLRFSLRWQEAPLVQGSLFANQPQRTFPGEPDPQDWTRCECGHDMYIHPNPGYGGCLYGEGCTCQRFKLCKHAKTQPQQTFDGSIDKVCTRCGARVTQP
jgi:hypothetical protein